MVWAYHIVYVHNFFLAFVFHEFSNFAPPPTFFSCTMFSNFSPVFWKYPLLYSLPLFVCFVVINLCVLSANAVDLGFFCFINFPILLTPPPPPLVCLFGVSDYLVRDYYLYVNILHQNFLITPQPARILMTPKQFSLGATRLANVTFSAFSFGGVFSYNYFIPSNRISWTVLQI